VSFFDVVEQEVREFRRNDIRPTGWRIALAETIRSELGVESNRAGSPYRPLAVTQLAGGRFVVQWSDGLLSRGSLSRAPREDVRDMIASAFEGRYEDPDAAIFSPEAAVPQVDIFSEESAAAADGRDADLLPGVLSILEQTREKHGARVLDGGARASRVPYSIALDSLVWDGHQSRSPIGPDEVVEQAGRTAADFVTLKAPADSTPRGPHDVVLHPRVAESFLDTFLFPNLSGTAVANGRSRFEADEFRNGAQAFREDFAIDVRPHEAMGAASFRFTDEGVPSRAFSLVRDGRLTTPSLSLKYAKRLGFAPAPLPGSMEGLTFRLEGDLTRDEALLSGPPRVLVHSVLGLHTQDTVRGEYSVLAPQSVLYRDGGPRGRVSATLNGSFFEDLRGEELRLVRFPGFSVPGILVRAELS
jgi:PmbA protein